jgi:hypothetical protein
VERVGDARVVGIVVVVASALSSVQPAVEGGADAARLLV